MTDGAGATPTGAVALAVDVGGTKAEAALVRLDGSIVEGSRHRAATGADSTVNTLTATLHALVHRALYASPADAALIGAGIGSAGPMDREHRAVSPVNMPAAAGIPVADIVSAAIAESHPPAPATLALDGTALALAEHWLTPGQPTQSLLGIVVSTGVGGGIVIDGRPLLGGTGNAGQIGQCYASGYGAGTTLEEIASGPATVRHARAGGWDGHTGEDLARSAAAGDETAQEAIARSARVLGDAIASLAAAVDFGRVVIAGGFSRVTPDYIPRVRERLQHHPFAHVRGIPIEPAARPADAPLIGAAALAFTAAGQSTRQPTVVD